MTLRLAALVSLAAALGAPAARAEAPAPALPEDPRAPRYAEVERGLFAGFETGAIFLFRTPVADRAKFPFAGSGGGRASGLVVGAHVGVDLTDRLALAVFGLGANAEAGPSYGAFDVAAFGGDLRWTLLGGRDRNGVARLHAYLHARGGWVATRPSGLLGTSDLLVAGGPGVEYFTRLRHFSVGLATDFLYLTRASVAGASITPTVRYTF